MFTTTRNYGVSQPICTAMPTKEDLDATTKLQQALTALNVFETEKELTKRVAVLASLNYIVANWIQQTAKALGMPDEKAARVGGKLHAFGSYGIGAHTRGADIDTVCVAPRHVNRADFFCTFLAMLKADENAMDVHAVEGAFVPVIKLTYSGVEIDMLFARLDLDEIPEDLDLTDTALLKKMDEKSVRSLNGLRLCKEILGCVPNRETFTTALRAIKVWAKNRSIYSNALGFLGGVSWAILVARTCQLYPNAAAATIVNKFFFLYSNWKWPHPIVLKNADGNCTTTASLDALVWNPQTNVSDRYHVMPIITPTYPEQNSTFNVTKSTLRIIMKEIKEGLETTNAIAAGTSTWKQLLEPMNYFSQYRHYVCLQCSAATKDDLTAFAGLIESRIRKLVASLERNHLINFCHVNPKQFAQKDSTSPTSLWFIGLEFIQGVKINIDLTNDMQQFADMVVKSAVAANFYKESMIIKAFFTPRTQLSKLISTEDLGRGRHYKMTKRESSKPKQESPKTDSRKRKAEIEPSSDVKRCYA
uniref:Poly(A) polymerase n=1 Tax=Panagrellus redivivus TaxID=6233 RepID=A0A7E4ZV70_PANRE